MQQSQVQNHSRVMKIKEGQSNIFHNEVKDQFNSQAKLKKSLQDKIGFQILQLMLIEIAAYNINWWNTNQYKDIPLPIQNLSPYKMIEHHNQEIENIYQQVQPVNFQSQVFKEKKQPLQDNVNETFKRKNHLFSDILESGLQKYYYEQKNENKKDHRQIPNNLQWNQFDSRLHSKDYLEQKQQEKMQDLVQEMESDARPGSKYAQRQMIKEMKSVFDTHNYYEKVLNPPPPPPIVAPVVIEEPVIEIQESPKISYIFANWIVRGVSNKFDWIRFRDESAKLDVVISTVVENIEKFSKQKVYSVTLKAFQQKQLNDIEKKLLTQGGRIMKKMFISEEEFNQQMDSQQEKVKPPPTPISKMRAQSAKVGKQNHAKK